MATGRVANVRPVAVVLLAATCAGRTGAVAPPGGEDVKGALLAAPGAAAGEGPPGDGPPGD
jgi:hypothetical protein